LVWVDAYGRVEVEGVACGDEGRGLADAAKAARQIAEDAKALAEVLEKVAELWRGGTPPAAGGAPRE